MPRPLVLLVAATTGYQARQFGVASERLGIELVLATDRCHILENPWGDQAIPVRFEQLEESAEMVAAALGERSVDGVLGIGERPALLAGYTAERLGILFHSSAALERASNKHLMRERLREAGLPVPWYWLAPLADEPEEWAAKAEYPCVLKPLGLSASRGVIRADGPTEFASAFRRIRRLLQQPDLARLGGEGSSFLQVEQYLPGREFAVEGVVTEGRLQVFALFDKPDPLDGPFFEETIYVTPSREREETQRLILEAVRDAAAALEITHGPLHAEVRWNDNGAWVLEVAGRPIGGLCARSLAFHGGETLEGILLRHTIGEDVSQVRLAGAATGVMMIPIPKEGVLESLSGEVDARSIPGIFDVVITAKIGQKLIPLPEGASYLGFLFARGGSAESVEAALRAAWAKLRFEIFAALPVV